MTRSLLIPRPPDSKRPMVVFHVGIDARHSGAAIKLLFLNFPSRDDLLAECDLLPEARFMVERADLPEAWPEERSEWRIEVPGLKGTLGRISVTREVLIPNAGRLVVEVRE